MRKFHYAQFWVTGCGERVTVSRRRVVHRSTSTVTTIDQREIAK